MTQYTDADHALFAELLEEYKRIRAEVEATIRKGWFR